MDVTHSYGDLAVLRLDGVECLGTARLGETARAMAAAYAGQSRWLNRWLILAVTSAGAIIGDNIGDWIGRNGGHHLAGRPYPA